MFNTEYIHVQDSDQYEEEPEYPKDPEYLKDPKESQIELDLPEDSEYLKVKDPKKYQIEPDLPEDPDEEPEYREEPEYLKDPKKYQIGPDLPEDPDEEPEYPARDDDAGVWELCDNCNTMLYLRFLKRGQMICPKCGYHLQMTSTDRIELLIDKGTWEPMDEDMLPYDVLEFVDLQPYSERLEETQSLTGLPDAVQTGTGTIKGTWIALAVMDFAFMGGSMGCVVGEKITRLIEYATEHQLPVVIVCASGGARIQEGTLSLMQMAKIAAALHIHQTLEELLLISILTSPTTGGVTASFGMLGDIIIAEPNAYIAFAGKRVIEYILKIVVPDDAQLAEKLFACGLMDLILPRSLLKGALAEMFEFYRHAPYCENKNEDESKNRKEHEGENYDYVI